MTTIREIADKAQVSTSAVSRILNHDVTLHVAPKTRANVLSIAKELGYTKKIRVNSQKQRYTFGILQWYSTEQELIDPYYLCIRLGAENYLKRRGMHIIRAFKTDKNYEQLLANVNCLICIGKFNSKEIKKFEKLCKHFIVVDMYTQRLECNTIVVDMPQAVEDMLSYLYQLGHRRIAFLGGKEYLGRDVLYYDRRKSIFTNFCLEHQLPIDHMILEESFSSASGYRLMNKLFENNKTLLPTAIFAASDSIAIGAMRSINEHQLQLPKDISIAGFNDIESARFTSPPLTTIKAPARELGEYAARFLEHVLNSNDPYNLPIRIALPCNLQIRQSCTKPNL